MLFGCVAGKDRTGLLACLVLSVLEVDKANWGVGLEGKEKGTSVFWPGGGWGGGGVVPPMLTHVHIYFLSAHFCSWPVWPPRHELSCGGVMPQASGGSTRSAVEPGPVLASTQPLLFAHPCLGGST